MNEESIKVKLIKPSKPFNHIIEEMNSNVTNYSNNLAMNNTLNSSNNNTLNSFYSSNNNNNSSKYNLNEINNVKNSHNITPNIYQSTFNDQRCPQQKQFYQNQANHHTQHSINVSGSTGSDLYFSNNQLFNGLSNQCYNNEISNPLVNRKPNLLMDKKFYQCVESLHKSISDLIQNQSKSKDYISSCHNNSCTSECLSFNNLNTNNQSKIHDYSNDTNYYQETIHDDVNHLDEEKSLREFAEFFKSRRMKLGATQSDVGNDLANLNIHGVESLSQSTICRFESLTLSHNNMLALRPILATWLQQAEDEHSKKKHKLSQVHTGNSLDIGIGKFDNGKRKRTSIGPIEKKTLEYSFIRSSHPTADEINNLSQSLELSKDVIRVWFCNRRQKGKRLKI